MTPKQQRFIDAYLLEPNATKAAIIAGYSQNNAAVIGHQVLKKTKDFIAAKLAEASERANITLDNHLECLKRLSEKAAAAKQYGPAVSAEVARGKAAGLYIERTEGRNTELHIIRID